MAAKVWPVISVTGKSPQLGFTLLEVMVVIVIIGGIASLVAVNFASGSSSSNLESSYQQLRIQMQALSRKAMAEQRWFGLRFAENQYQAMIFTDQGWNKLDSKAVNWPSELDLELVINGHPVNPHAQAQIPQLHFSPEGLITPFRLRLSDLSFSYELEDPYASVH